MPSHKQVTTNPAATARALGKYLINPVYIGHSWKLSTTMKKEYFKQFKKEYKVSVHNRIFNEPYKKVRINIQLHK